MRKPIIALDLQKQAEIVQHHNKINQQFLDDGQALFESVGFVIYLEGLLFIEKNGFEKLLVLRKQGRNAPVLLFDLEPFEFELIGEVLFEPWVMLEAHLLGLHGLKILINFNVGPEVFKKVKNQDFINEIRKEKAKKADAELELHFLEVLLPDFDLHFEHLHEIPFVLRRRLQNGFLELLLRVHELLLQFDSFFGLLGHLVHKGESAEFFCRHRPFEIPRLFGDIARLSNYARTLNTNFGVCSSRFM